MVSGANSQSTARLAIDHRIKLKATPSRAGPELILGSISAFVERFRPQTVTRIQRSIILYLFRRPSAFPFSRTYFNDTARSMPGFLYLYSSQHGVHSDTNFITFSAISPAYRNCVPSPESPHRIPIEGRPSNCAVITSSIVMLLNACGIITLYLYVRAHQHMPVTERPSDIVFIQTMRHRSSTSVRT